MRVALRLIHVDVWLVSAPALHYVLVDSACGLPKIKPYGTVLGL